MRTELKARIEVLRQNKAKLLEKHKSFQSAILANEEEIVTYREQKLKTSSSQIRRLQELERIVTERVKMLQDVRSRHLREVDLYKRSCSNKWITAEPLRTEIQQFEVKLAAMTAEEREAAARYQASLAQSLEAVEHLQLELGQVRRKAGQGRGRLQLQETLESAPTPLPSPSARQLLDTIKQRFTPSGMSSPTSAV